MAISIWQRREDLHGVDDTNALNKESQQTYNTQKKFDLINLFLALLKQIPSGDHTC